MAYGQTGQHLIDDPRVGPDARALQVAFERRRLVHGSRFGQRDEQDARKRRVTQLRQEPPNGFGRGAGLAFDLAVVRLGGVEQEQRANASKAAISVVQAPDSCSVMLQTVAGGSRPRTGPTMRSR